MLKSTVQKRKNERTYQQPPCKRQDLCLNTRFFIVLSGNNLFPSLANWNHKIYSTHFSQLIHVFWKLSYKILYVDNFSMCRNGLCFCCFCSFLNVHLFLMRNGPKFFASERIYQIITKFIVKLKNSKTKSMSSYICWICTE